MSNLEIKERAKRSNLDKYEVEYASQSPIVKEKIRNTNISNKKQINIGGFSLTELSKKHNISRTTMSVFLRSERPTEEQFLDFINNYSLNQMTLLEIKLSKVLGLVRYNKKPISLIGHYKPDFKLNDNIYINADSFYWHSEVKVIDSYHFDMLKSFEDSGLLLLQFREDEIYNKFNIVESMVNNLLDKLPKIDCENTEIKEVLLSEAVLFLENNHIVGEHGSNNIGLFLNNELIYVLSYTVNENSLDLVCFCSILGHNVSNGFGKLFSHIKTLYSHLPIYCWIDLRYETGNFLLNYGFEFSHNLEAQYQWTDFRKIYGSDDIKNTNKELHLYKIYDAGHRLYIRPS